jgi:hypothetical protein
MSKVAKLPKGEQCLCPECRHYHSQVPDDPDQYKRSVSGSIICLCRRCASKPPPGAAKLIPGPEKHASHPDQLPLPGFEGLDVRPLAQKGEAL